MNNVANAESSVLVFDGVDDYLTLPEGFAIIDQAITIEFWAKGENSLKQSTTIFWSSPGNRVVNAHLPWDGNIYWDAGDDGSFDRINKGVKLKEYNVWTNWAFAKDVTTGKMLVYRNGEIWCQGEGKQKSLAGIKQKQLYIGCEGGNNYFWKGSLTEFRIWNTVRTSEEIKQNMNSRLTGNEPGLVAYYPLNGDANDKTNNGKNGTINGATWEQSEVPIVDAQPQELERKLLSTGLEDYGFWSQEMTKLKAEQTEPDKPFRRGRIWC